MAEDSVRDILESKFVDNVDAPQTNAIEGEAHAPEAPAPVSDAPSTPAPATPESPPEPISEPSKPDSRPTSPPVSPKTPQAQVADTAVPAPQAWKPEAREAFKALPPIVQQEVARRERDVARYVQETAQIRQHFDSFVDTCRPYGQLIALDGGDPMKTFGEYLKTGAVLRLGTPTEKAHAIAQAVRQFDVNIGALDTALAQLFGGQVPQQGFQQPQTFKDPRLDELLGAIEQTKAQREQELEHRQLTEINTFRTNPKNEFFDDLRPDIADLLEINARRGVKMTLDEAYTRAAAMHPEISKVVQQRRTQEAVTRQKQLIDQKRRAVSGAPGAPLPRTNGADPDDLRSVISAAMDAHSQPV
jgi:hypothetical protein